MDGGKKGAPDQSKNRKKEHPRRSYLTGGKTFPGDVPGDDHGGGEGEGKLLGKEASCLKLNLLRE